MMRNTGILGICIVVAIMGAGCRIFIEHPTGGGQPLPRERDAHPSGTKPVVRPPKTVLSPGRGNTKQCLRGCPGCGPRALIHGVSPRVDGHALRRV